MKRILFLAFAALLLAGCQQSVQTGANGEDYQATVSTEDGDVHISGSSQNADEWCQAGSTWAMTGDQADANMVIEGLVTTGKYAGYCHVTYDATTAQGETHVDYYFNKDGSAGYQVMDVNGQTYESEWTG